MAQREKEVRGVVLSHCARNSFVVEVLKKSNRTKLRLKQWEVSALILFKDGEGRNSLRDSRGR